MVSNLKLPNINRVKVNITSSFTTYCLHKKKYFFIRKKLNDLKLAIKIYWIKRKLKLIILRMFYRRYFFLSFSSSSSHEASRLFRAQLRYLLLWLVRSGWNPFCYFFPAKSRKKRIHRVLAKVLQACQHILPLFIF